MELTERVFESNDVHQLVDQLSRMFQKAIIIENVNFELIAYSSPNEFLFDPTQQKTILTKRCPLFIIERLKKEGIIDRLNRKREPIRIETIEDINFYQRVAISLKSKGQVYGYLWIYEADTLFEKSDFIFLTKIAPHLGKLLYQLQKDTLDDEQSIIWKLVNNEYLNQAEIYREANIAAYTLPEKFSIIVISIKDPSYLYVLQKIKDLFTHEKIAHYLGKGTEIVGVIDGNSIEQVSRQTKGYLDELKHTLTSEEQLAIYIGIGNEYEKIDHIRKSYLEALEVIETMFFLHVDEQITYYFHKLGMYRYIKLMYKKNIDEQYRNKNISLLIKKDLESNSELLKTLSCFLQNDCKVGQTATQLFIHPNTLNYRLKQIVSLTAIDFSNVDEKMELYSQLLILQHVPDYEQFYKK